MKPVGEVFVLEKYLKIQCGCGYLTVGSEEPLRSRSLDK